MCDDLVPSQEWLNTSRRRWLVAFCRPLALARGIHLASHPLVSGGLFFALLLATLSQARPPHAPSTWGLMLLGASLFASVLTLKPLRQDGYASRTLPLWITPLVLLGAYLGLALLRGGLWRLPSWYYVIPSGLLFVGIGWLAVGLAPALSLRCLALTVPSVLAWVLWGNPWPVLIGLPLSGWAQVRLGRRRPAHVVLGVLLGGLLASSLLILLVGG